MVTVCFVQEKLWHFQLRKFHILYYPGMLKFCNHLIIQFLLLPLSVKLLLTGGQKQRKIQTFSTKSGCSHLSEVVPHKRVKVHVCTHILIFNYIYLVIWHGNLIWCFRKLIAEERWLQLEVHHSAIFNVYGNQSHMHMQSMVKKA